jgi:hypothetical protein
VLVAFTDPNAKSTGGGGSGEAVPFTSPENENTFTKSATLFKKKKFY